MNALPIIIIRGKSYYVDERLKQLRNIDNPHDFIDVTEAELQYIVEEDTDNTEITYVCNSCRTQIDIVGEDEIGYCDFCESPVFVEKS